MTPVILHVDVNSAFLSWSALKERREHPEQRDLRDIPSAVGGDVKTRHGIISAKSIPAKQYDIHTGEPVVKALEKCPQLVLVPSDFALYRDYSHHLMDILRSYANAVEQVSIDEAYLDVTGCTLPARQRSCPGPADSGSSRSGAQPQLPSHSHSGSAPVHVYSPRGGFFMPEELTGHIPGSFRRIGAPLPAAAAAAFPYDLANAIREEVYRTLGFTVNVGISSNRLLAKMASDFTKPGRIHTLWPEEVPQKMWPLPIGELHGCGGKTAGRLNDFGILTIGEAAHADLSLLQSVLGEKGGLYIHNAANGISSSMVSDIRDDAKSYSNETTVSNDIFYENYDNDAVPVIHALSQSVARRLQRDGVYASTIDLSVKTDDFRRSSRQTQLPESTNDAAVIESTALSLARKLLFGTEGASGLFARGKKVRLIGVGASNLDHGEYRQLDLFGFLKDKQRQDAQTRADQQAQEKAADKARRLQNMMDQIQHRYGQDAIHKGE